jgi:hypothetical protein
MPILNYTTQIDAFKTISQIQQMLAGAGASAIMTEMDGTGSIVALSFKIKMNDQDIAFKLPTDWRPVLEVLQQDPRVTPKLKTQEQAMRVAWRITKDWVEAQLAFVETMMVTTAQVFLPYAITKSGQTLYEHIGQDPKLLLGGNNEANS